MSAVMIPHPQSVATWDAGQVDIIKQMIAPGISDAELRLFALVCQRTGLDPFLKQIYAIMRNDKGGGKRMSIQTGIDGYRLMAARTGELAGIDDAEFDTEEAQHPRWAKVTVWRFVKGQRVPFTARARWQEYSQQSPMWSKMPFLMLAKCAESLALRKAFPAELSGIYTHEEMAQAGPAPIIDEPQWATSDQRQKLNRACEMLGYEMITDEEFANTTFTDAAVLLDEYRREYQRRQTAVTDDDQTAA